MAEAKVAATAAAASAAAAADKAAAAAGNDLEQFFDADEEEVMAQRGEGRHGRYCHSCDPLNRTGGGFALQPPRGDPMVDSGAMRAAPHE